MKDGLQDAKKKLRGYLKSYRICQEQAEEIAMQMDKNEVFDAVKEMLLQAKSEFVRHCRNVHLILGYLSQDSIMYRVVSLRYLQGLSMKAIANKLQYSVGYCQNVEAEAMEYLSGHLQVLKLIEV